MVTDWIAILRTGTHTASNGQAVTLTTAVLDRIVSSYDPSFHEAPVCIGHPADSKPAFGWVGELRRQGEILSARLKDLSPMFAEAVRKGFFRKRSASIYPDLEGKGPYLKHIAFLGAVPPAIKGLPDVSFSERRTHPMSHAVSIDFSEGTDSAAARLDKLTKQKMKEESLSFSEAFRQVQEENPDLTLEYCEEMRPL